MRPVDGAERRSSGYTHLLHPNDEPDIEAGNQDDEQSVQESLDTLDEIGLERASPTTSRTHGRTIRNKPAGMESAEIDTSSVVGAICAMLRPYFQDKSSRSCAWLSISLNVGLSFVEVVLNWWGSYVQRDYVNALQIRDTSFFEQSISIYIVCLLLKAAVSAANQYVVQWAALGWRTFLTRSFLHRYLSGVAFYRLLVAGPDGVDNPDQRIGEDIQRFTTESMSNLHSFVDGTTKIILFSSVLLENAGLLTCTIGYAVLGQLILVPIFGSALMKWSRRVLTREASLRAALVQVREHAESLAFYQGGGRACGEIRTVYDSLLKSLYSTLRWSTLLSIVKGLYSWLAEYLPILWLWSLYFSGTVELGVLVQAHVALGNVLAGMTEVLNNLERLAGWAADSMRLQNLWLALDQEEVQQLEDGIKLVEDLDITDDSDGNSVVLRLEALTVTTPVTHTLLCSELDLELRLGTSILVVGPSGCGKSSLLRAVAGLWSEGSGRVHRVSSNLCCFIPQRPYMVIGTLLEQVLYPQSSSAGESELDTTVELLLRSLNLGSVLDRYTLYDRCDWGSTLSLGEQQRIAFARVIMQRPRLAFLDEATSGLDDENEVLCYEKLRMAAGSLVSVGHRRALKRFHDVLLEPCETDNSVPPGWKIVPMPEQALEGEEDGDVFEEDEEDFAPDFAKEETSARESHAREPDDQPADDASTMCAAACSRASRLSSTLRSVWQACRIMILDQKALISIGCFVGSFFMVVNVLSAISVKRSFIQRELDTALQQREESAFLRSLVGLVPFMLGGYVLDAGKDYLAKWAAYAWRTQMTQRLVERYTQANNFYRLKMYGDQCIDNPDQRIGQNVAQFCLVGTNLSSNVWSTIFGMITISLLMVYLDANFFFLGLAWSLIAQALALELFGASLVKLTQEVLAQEAHFRFALMRIRENAEAIAFYQGAQREAAQVSLLYETLLATLFRRARWHRIYWQSFRRVEDLGKTVLPLLLASNSYLIGSISYGELMQLAATCTGLIRTSEVVLEYMVSDQENGLASIAGDADRIIELWDALSQTGGHNIPLQRHSSSLVEPFLKDGVGEARRIQVFESLSVGQVALRLQGLRVLAPKTSALLCSGLDLELCLGESLLVRGRSGSGKTSILRAIAGLWDHGRGEVHRPPVHECAFVPQNPLLIRGTLRQQLLYPSSTEGDSDPAICDALKTVRLGSLLEVMGLDDSMDWSTTLSLGEQQRIAFARVLIHRPRLAFLDEATSGLDRATEAQCYKALRSSAGCYVSVGHRSALAEFHTRSLKAPSPCTSASENLARWRLAHLSFGY
mmetsp:Transcript_2594/g.6629  ORF Transcript_2594/g.6629 Transcript_2594/m.6629 type:complete len:1312 (+) Transcript_2594:109-4044(+)